MYYALSRVSDKLHLTLITFRKFASNVTEEKRPYYMTSNVLDNTDVD